MAVERWDPCGTGMDREGGRCGGTATRAGEASSARGVVKLIEPHEVLLTPEGDQYHSWCEQVLASGELFRDAKGKKEIADAKVLSIKADYDSINSLINIAQDDADHATSESARTPLSVNGYSSTMVCRRDRAGRVS